jgi:hypothetical protein
MSALELYTQNYEFSYAMTNSISIIIIVLAMLFIQINVHLMYTDELDRVKASFDKRITALHEDVDRTIQRLTPLEEVTKTLIAAQGDIDADLYDHEVLLEEHGEDISLVAQGVYASAPKTNSQSVQTTLFDPNVQYVLDDHIKNYLGKTDSATAREIFKHLKEDTGTQEAWVKMYSTTGHKITRHDVNSRLYALMAQGELKKDDSARPTWSL